MSRRGTTSERFIAVKIDVVRSRRAKDRSALQSKLFAAAKTCNQRYAQAIASRFVVTHGDEVQGMIHIDERESMLGCIETWIGMVRPHRLRFGIGLGTLSTDIQPEAIGMDGACWHLAKEALERTHKERKAVQILGISDRRDSVVTALANLIFVLRVGWTAKQEEAALLMETYETQSQAAERLGISAATFSNHLSAAHWHEYRAGRAALVDLLGESVPAD